MRAEAISEIFDLAKSEGRNFLYEHEAKKLIAHYDMPVTQISVVNNENDAVKAANKIGYPIVLRIISPQILHKSDAGGVIININNDKGSNKKNLGPLSLVAKKCFNFFQCNCL